MFYLLESTSPQREQLVLNKKYLKKKFLNRVYSLDSLLREFSMIKNIIELTNKFRITFEIDQNNFVELDYLIVEFEESGKYLIVSKISTLDQFETENKHYFALI